MKIFTKMKNLSKEYYKKLGFEKVYRFFERNTDSKEIDSSLRVIFLVIFSFSFVTLFEYYRLNYFGIPYDFLNYGVKENIIILSYFLSALFGGWSFFLALLLFVLPTIWTLFFCKNRLVIIIFLSISVCVAERFGSSISREVDHFFTFSETCKSYQNAKRENKTPLILTNTGGKYVTVYVDDKNKLLPGFSLEEPEPYPCVVFPKELGKVIK